MGNGKIKAMTPMPAQNPGVMTFQQGEVTPAWKQDLD